MGYRIAIEPKAPAIEARRSFLEKDQFANALGCKYFHIERLSILLNTCTGR
jgi:hypothetical protein